MQVGLLYDLANPAEWWRDPGDLYRGAVEQAARAERLGIDAVWFTEHHFVDGYAASPLALMAAVAGRTSRVRIGTAVAVAPLHHPIRLAEELATIDLLSGGRVEFGVGVGWAAREYQAFGVDPGRRISRTREVVEVVRLAWDEEDLTFHGRHFSFDRLRVLPKPLQRPHPPLWGGASSPEGGRRVGRDGLGLMWLERPVVDAYLQGWQDAGRPPADARINGYLNLLVCDDPERTWSEVMPHFRYQRARSRTMPRTAARGRVVMAPEPTIEDMDALRADGSMLLLTPSEATAEIRRRTRGLPVSGVFCHNTIPGMPDELSERHIELLATVVAPALRRR